MDGITVSVVVIAVTFAVVAVFLVRFLIEVRKTVMAVRGLVTRIDTELVPTVHELQGVLANVKVTVAGVASRVDDVTSAMAAVGDTGRNISRINSVVGEVAGLVDRTSIWRAGVAAAGRHVMERISRRKG
jgi:uncharacterized protein YoxC